MSTPSSANIISPQRGSRWLRKAWLLLTIPAGFTTWAAFLYIGIRARRLRWIGWACVYLAMLVSWLVLWGPDPTETALNVGAVLAILNWIGGGVHAIVVSNSAVRRISIRNDPAIEAAAARIELRAEGQDLLKTRPAIARDIGVGRPDVPGAHDYGLIDVNHCPASTLTRLPGITDELAQQIADGREQAGGYSSVEDLGMLLTLPPAAVDLLRDLTVFPPI